MKKIFFLLILLSLFFSYYGQSTIEFEKEWVISGEPSKINFTGIFLLNTTEQRVVEVEVDPPLKIISDGDRLLAYYYGDFDGYEIFRARAKVINYYEPRIENDPQIVPFNPQSTPLTAYDDEMAKTAISLTNSSSLASAVALSNFVHKNMVYDISYSGKNIPAKIVFKRKEGVCAEYTHLFISLANSIGLETRYVGGYALTDKPLNIWQPHAWAQVKVGNKWISFDPTFAEGGVLTSSRVAVSYGKDADEIYDKIQSGKKIELETRASIELINESMRDDNVSIFLSFDEQNKVILIKLENPTSYFAVGTYRLLLPDNYGGEQKKVILLAPFSAYEEKVELNGNFADGFVYHIPIEVKFNDNTYSKEIVIEKKTKLDKSCASALIFLTLIFLVRSR
ncbi:MAG: transglutaminase-like domain-containing protein [Candidatus Bilamarchaeaceae archaeon]